MGLGHDITRVRLAGAVAEAGSTMAEPAQGAYEARVFGRGDGRIVQWGARVGVQVLELRRPALTFPLPRVRVKHLAAATRDHVWYSCPSPDMDYENPVVDNRYAANLLARVATPTVADFEADFAPARVTHLASGGGAVVALVTLPVDISVLRATLVVIDDDGVERWRAEVPAAIDPGGFRLDSSFVAISEHRVILCRDDARLFAWDAATGAALGVLR